jgi:ATP-dependent helicase HrpB
MTDRLPVIEVLPALNAALGTHGSAVLVAPPGAGKTTTVAPALRFEPWCTGQIILTSPRRLAARAAAERMAERSGETVGGTIGYATRLDSRHGANTRILVVTEGIFRNRIEADPALAGVSAVLFDEVHERSLDSDFSIALALDVQAGLRPDLLLVAMSATLEGARFASLFGNAPVIESKGKTYPLDIRHVGRDASERIEDAVAAAVRSALATQAGDVLAFLPGVAEIERTAERLAGVEAAVHPLHGALDPVRQRAAIVRAPDGGRKVVLATSIAETSLTIDGVRIVIDSGLARRPRYDRGSGLTRLETVRISQAAATQRAGRAARQGPGIAVRLWEAAATRGLAPFDRPEILEADLSGMLLASAIWGARDPQRLRWIDPPPVPALDEARRRLVRLGALDAAGAPTAHGRRIAGLPLPPRLAHMLIRAADRGWARTAAAVAVLLTERGLGGNDVDLERRLRIWSSDPGSRAAAARRLAARWAAMVGDERSQADAGVSVGACVALAYPDRIAQARASNGIDWASSGGRGFKLDAASTLAGADYLAVAEAQGQAAGARILAAARIDAAMLEELFSDEIAERRTVTVDSRGIALPQRERRLGALVLSAGSDDMPDEAAIVEALVRSLQSRGLEALPVDAACKRLQARTAYARGVDPSLPDVSDLALVADAAQWLPDLLAGNRRLDAVSTDALRQLVEARLGWAGLRQLDRHAPDAFETPAGSRHMIDYASDARPSVDVRVQSVFGLKHHPTIGAGVPLVLRLTSPAGRPIQTTTDLPGFWAGSWADVAREMRGCYPKHAWPDDPASAAATLRTKRASH